MRINSADIYPYTYSRTIVSTASVKSYSRPGATCDMCKFNKEILNAQNVNFKGKMGGTLGLITGELLAVGLNELVLGWSGVVKILGLATVCTLGGVFLGSHFEDKYFKNNKKGEQNENKPNI